MTHISKFPMHPASGTGIVTRFSKVIRFVRLGCTNRPFFHIVVIDKKHGPKKPPIEQLGTYDPMINVHNEKLVAFNFERIQYWMSRGASLTTPVAELLGLAGFLPVHPKSYLKAWRNRRRAENADKKSESEKQATSAN